MKKEARHLGLIDSVRVQDFLQPMDLVREYQKSDVFVLASRFDSYGVVVHEAAAAGLPLVVSRYVGASATLVEHGVNGYQIDPEDIEGFAEALLLALDAERNAVMGRKSREIASKYDVTHVAQRTKVWLEQMIRLFEHTHPRLNLVKDRITRYRGFLCWAHSLVRVQFSKVIRWLNSDAFGMERRDVVFLNRYIPFYREGIFRRVADWRSTKLLFSGKTLGNLRSVEGVDQEAVSSIDWRKGTQSSIVWLGATFQLMRTRPRVVCTEMSLSLWSTWWWFLLRRLLGFGLVFWTHGFQIYGWKGTKLGLKDRVRLWWMNWADAVIFYSQERMRDVERFTGPKEQFFVAPNTLDTNAYKEQYELLEREGREAVRRRLGLNRKTLIYVGRLTEEKGVMHLPELLKRTVKSPVAPDLIVIGGGEKEGVLTKSLQVWPDRVRMLGPIFDASQRCAWIYAADLMICMGYAGLNVVDSLAMGCPYATIDDKYLPYRHSPEISYLKNGVNALVADSHEVLSDQLAQWAAGNILIQLEREEIRSEFSRNVQLKSNSAECERL
ncbi:MAG: glycosyltransferase [Blastochloris sp.]|nr:glycosyltransferase [Blastochloris sp.]